MTGRVRGWLVQFWEDLRQSTDPSLLGIARLLGLLYGPIDGRSRIDVSLRKALGYRLPAHVTWRHALGSIAYLLLMVQVATGVLLVFYFRPSAQEAYASIQYIQSQAPFGWLIRGLHVWCASLLIVVLLAHLARVFFGGAYKPPRETNWLIGVGLFGVVLAFGASGYLLPWDQWAYWTFSEGLELVSAIPVVGGLVTELLRGYSLVSGSTLSRQFALHVVLLPWLLFVLLGLHFTLIRRHGITPPPGRETSEPGVRFYPVHLMRSLMVAAVTLAVLITLATWFTRPVGPPADPGEMPRDLISTWLIVDIGRTLGHFLGGWGVALFVLLGVALALLPLFDRGPERRLRERPLVLAAGIAFFAVTLVTWGVGRTLQSRGPVPHAAPAEAPARPVPFGADEGGIAPLHPDSTDAITAGRPR